MGVQRTEGKVEEVKPTEFCNTKSSLNIGKFNQKIQETRDSRTEYRL